MKIGLTRGRAVLGGATVAVVVAIASVASACVPGGVTNFTKLTISPATGMTGDRLTATANNFERGNWPYMVKVVTGTWDSTSDATKARCGREGLFQTEAKTGDNPNHPLTHPPFTAPFESSGGWDAHDFSQPFVLNAAGLPAGTAYFCAIPGAEPNTSGAQGTEVYVDEGFTVVTLV